MIASEKELFEDTPQRDVRKVILQMLGGAVFGFLFMIGLDYLIDMDVLFDRLSGPEILAFTFAVIFTLIGLIVIAMSFSRRLFMTNHRNEGASEAEFTGVKPMLRWSSICLFLYAAALLGLALTGQFDAGQKILVFWGVVLAMVGQSAISMYLWRSYDELYRGVTRESCATAFVITEILLFVWGAAALCGLQIAFEPLAVIVAVMGIYWTVSIWFVAKRGLV
ncbi:MAG: hypothetical protein IBJ12_03780 [Sphingomonadaceae bacterium]|nr:hypothetical protein [Sphingomonadaceae bacterium]